MSRWMVKSRNPARKTHDSAGGVERHLVRHVLLFDLILETKINSDLLIQKISSLKSALTDISLHQYIEEQ